MPEIAIHQQIISSAGAEASLYTVPTGKYAIISACNVANRGASAVPFRLSISKAGAATATKDYLYYDVDVPTKDRLRDDFNLQDMQGIKLSSGDVIRVYASTNELSFNLFGKEVGVI